MTVFSDHLTEFQFMHVHHLDHPTYSKQNGSFILIAGHYNVDNDNRITCYCFNVLIKYLLFSLAISPNVPWKHNFCIQIIKFYDFCMCYFIAACTFTLFFIVPVILANLLFDARMLCVLTVVIVFAEVLVTWIWYLLLSESDLSIKFLWSIEQNFNVDL